MADCAAKGRAPGGRGRHLKEHQVQEIRRLLMAGERPAKVARIMNLAPSTISKIGSGRINAGDPERKAA